MIAGHGVKDIEREDDEIGEEDNNSHTLLCGLLHIGHNGDELNLRAVTEAENGEDHQQVLIKDNALDLRVIARM